MRRKIKFERSSGNVFRDVVDFELKRGSKRAMIRTVWIVRRNEDYPRLLTCLVL